MRKGKIPLLLITRSTPDFQTLMQLKPQFGELRQLQSACSAHTPPKG